MTYNEGDILVPKEIIIPVDESLAGGKIGSLKVSGAKLYVYTTSWEIITST